MFYGKCGRYEFAAIRVMKRFYPLITIGMTDSVSQYHPLCVCMCCIYTLFRGYFNKLLKGLIIS